MRSLRYLLAGTLAVASCDASNRIRGPSQEQERARNLIVGGTAVDTGFEFFALMEYKGWFCGGALIDESHVLTSAYCLEHTFPNGRPHSVRVGALKDLTGSNLFGVECVQVHPDYDTSGPYPIADIAVVRLSGASMIEPVPLNEITAYPSFSSSLNLLGMGSTFNATTPASPTLQIAQLPYVDFDICQLSYNSLTEGNHFCAGRTNGTGGCIGDGGGPLLGVDAFHTSNELIVAGVYSFHTANCGNTTPDVFTAVAPYSLWIKFITEEACPITPAPTGAPSTSMMPSVSSAPSPDPTPAPTPNPTLSPTSSPTASPTSEPGTFCFSKDATVHVLGQGPVAMKDLQVGDQVFAGYINQGKTPIYETVYGFGHRNEERLAEYLRITTNASVKRPLEISGSHLIYVHGQKDPVRADLLQVGQELLKESQHHSKTTPVRITNIERVVRRGLYQPLTKDGTILVDGLQASTYVSVHEVAPRVVALGLNVFSEQSGFHLWMAPYRFVCTKVAPQLCSNEYSADTDGIAHWLVAGKGMMEVGESMPTWLLVVYIAVILTFCGAIVFLDSLLEGDVTAVASVICVLGLFWWWSRAQRRCAEKGKVA